MTNFLTTEGKNIREKEIRWDPSIGPVKTSGCGKGKKPRPLAGKKKNQVTPANKANAVEK